VRRLLTATPSPVLDRPDGTMDRPQNGSQAMPQLRIRITGSDDDLRAVADLLQSVEGIEHVEEVADLMPRMDDEDSSSAGLSDDIGPGTHELEVDAPNEYTAGRVREAVEELAIRLGLVVEFETDET
jgi:hypothetical protein